MDKKNRSKRMRSMVGTNNVLGEMEDGQYSGNEERLGGMIPLFMMSFNCVGFGNGNLSKDNWL